MKYFKYLIFWVLMLLPLVSQAQMLLGKFDCNAGQNGSLYGNNYLDSQKLI